jgi:hypothetical protein
VHGELRRGQQRVTVGTDGEKGDIAQIEKAGDKIKETVDDAKK